jgi:hypothetical protein
MPLRIGSAFESRQTAEHPRQMAHAGMRRIDGGDRT